MSPEEQQISVRGWIRTKRESKSFSFLELSNHIARLPGWGSATVETESLDLAPDGGQYEPPPPAESPRFPRLRLPRFPRRRPRCFLSGFCG